jgi:hypothetical protein
MFSCWRPIDLGGDPTFMGEMGLADPYTFSFGVPD